MELGGDEGAKLMKSAIGICSLVVRFRDFSDLFFYFQVTVSGRWNIFHSPKLGYRERHARAIDRCRFFRKVAIYFLYFTVCAFPCYIYRCEIPQSVAK